MAADNSNSTMEMGTSDQVLVAAKKKKRTAYIAGGVVMVIIIALIITAVVLLSGNEGDPEDPNTTEGTTLIPPITEPSSPEPPITDPDTEPPPTEPPVTEPPVTEPPDTEPPETEPPVTEPPVTEPPLPPIDLDELNDMAFSPTTFTANWVSGTEFMYVDANSNLVLHNAISGLPTTLVANSSEVIQQPSRLVERSADGSTAVIAHNAVPVYRHTFLARYTSVTIQGGAEQVIGPVGVPEPYLQNFVWAPQGNAMAFVYLNNVYYKANPTADAQQLTTTGVLNVLYNGIPDWVYEEEVFASPVALWFSPQGTHCSYATFDDSNVRVMNVPHYGVPGAIEDQYTRHNAIRYPKAGTVNPTVSVTIVNLANIDAATTVQAPASLNEPILLSVTFVTENSVGVVWANRVQNQMEVHLCTQGQAACTLIFSHGEPNGWIENNPLRFNAAGTSFVTVLPQVVDGQPWKQVVQVSQGEAGAQWTLAGRSNTPHTVAEILSWTSNDVVWYKATHVDDSAQQHLYSQSAGAAPSCFTCDVQHSSGANCLYNEAVLSSDNSLVTVTCAGPEVPEVYLYTAAGVRLSVWEDNAALSELVEQRLMPTVTRLSVPVQDGLPPARVLIQHPPNVESMTNVPLLVYVYAGPDSAQDTHSWSVDWGSSLVSRFNIAVAHIDGRGSGLKGVNNLFALNRRLGTIEVEDQITVTRYLHENLPYLNTSRTCIWGWSYGGYVSTLALARGGDAFNCAIAVAPVTDWRYYDTIYTERYMDTPTNNLEAYEQSSVLTNEVVEAFRDKRYFLVHGTADDNVHYQHAMLLSRQLQRQDVQFTQMSYTDEDHGLVGVRPHLYHALEKFLIANML